MDELLDLALQQTADGDVSPARDDLGDVLRRDLLLEVPGGPRVLLGRQLCELALQLWNLSVAQAREWEKATWASGVATPILARLGADWAAA